MIGARLVALVVLGPVGLGLALVGLHVLRFPDWPSRGWWSRHEGLMWILLCGRLGRPRWMKSRSSEVFAGTMAFIVGAGFLATAIFSLGALIVGL